jgi:8-oxo-dGTP pyrophosphatase MutT (NUDIX family)
MLDNTVAGGLMTGEDPLECVIREADEEASLPEDLVRSSIVPSGTVSYIYVTDERAGGESGLIYPEYQWIYDLELPAGVTPEPKDGEVESFSLLTVDEIKVQLARGRFKPNCALVMLDFFIRHGIITKDAEQDFDAIQQLLHRQLPFPGPSCCGVGAKE